MKPTVLSLFSGAGGLDLGFKKAGFEIVLSNDNDKSIEKTYTYNFSNTKHLNESITELSKKDINLNIDGIIGGPPCQSWSEAGKQKGIEDPRGKLFFEYIRLIKLKKPNFFLAENVSGMLHKKHNKSVNFITKKLSECGYEVKYELLDAVDYNVPQTRKRVFIIGVKKNIKKSFKFPTTEIFEKKKTLKDAIYDLPKPSPSKNKNRSNGINLKIKSNEIMNNEYMTGGFSTIYMSRNRVRSWNEPSFTIQAGGRHAPIHPSAPKMKEVGKDKRIFDKKKIKLYRRLSVRECARIQTFPDNFIFFYEKLSDAYKMIGNAVPVNLAYAIAKEIKKQIF